MASKRPRGRWRIRTIVHRDINGKAIALLVVFVLALGAVRLAQSMPPRGVEPRDDVVNALEAEGGRLYHLLPRGEGAMCALGLEYQPPQGQVRDESRISLELVRETGLLKGYSLPPGRIAFVSAETAQLLPVAPVVEGPRGSSAVFSGNRGKKKVALTFDTSEVSEQSVRALVDELTRLRAPATFFVCGAWCYQNPDMLRLLFDRGFEVANHSFDHPLSTRIPDERLAWEITGTAKAVEEVSGRKIAAYFRPPFGDFNQRVGQVAGRLGYTVVMWSKDTLDWHPATVQGQIRDRATCGAAGGDIILMHSLGRYTVGALAEIVVNLRSQGLELTTVSGVLE